MAAGPLRPPNLSLTKLLETTAHPGGGIVVRKMSPNEVNDEVTFVVLPFFCFLSRPSNCFLALNVFLNLIHCKPYY